MANQDLPIWMALTDLIVFLGLASSISLLFLFPSGAFVPRWTRAVAVGWTLLVLAAVVAIYIQPSLRRSIHVPAQVIAVGAAYLGAHAQVYRYRNIASPVERQQVKWAILGLIAAGLGPLVYLAAFAPTVEVVARQAPNLLNQRLGGSFFSLSYLTQLFMETLVALSLTLLPLSFAIAILRYRLWDIDLIIRRTLIYAVLTAVLAFFYFAFVVLTGVFFFFVIGEPSPIGIVISTLGIAALFSSARHRVQDAIDRRFYRRKYDAMQTLTTFAQTARDETDLDCLSGELVRVVKETMQPDQVILWLKPTAGDRRHRARSTG
ncbi:MAG: hypothetical protein HC802_12065 [Caldilineaceae bacterium]|nr:hypothetical protein [Caldilineaceae bacterium]